MQGTKLLNTKIMIPRLADDGHGSGGPCMLPVETFVGTESAAESGIVTLSFDIDGLAPSHEPGEIPAPLALLLTSADARALGKALVGSADVAERLAEELRLRR